jgi:23S rRNA pseudouridine1911/1915/1917 synthase
VTSVFEASTSFEGEPGRLDVAVARALGATRAEAQRVIEEGLVVVDGIRRARSFRLRGGEDVRIAELVERRLAAEGPPVPVRYQDAHLLVVSKPTGLVTHPTAARRTGTLVNRLLGMGIPLSTVGGSLRPGIVHRLDAGTSGLMIVAKDDSTHEALARLLRRHEVDRRYLALARGVVEHDRFTVDAALGRRGSRVLVRGIGGRGAETALAVRERFARATLLEATPLTGRTHQIRVHLSAVGHPILGDGRYGGGGDDAIRLGLRRPFLHSWHLSFVHPATGRAIEVEEGLPEELEASLERLRS